MSAIIHPRPNPIVAAMYTARDMDVDVIVIHGPAGCSFMASRPLENAGVHVVTSAMKDRDLIFGGASPLENALKEARDRFHPKVVAVVSTCASTIIGDDVDAIIKRVDMGGAKCFAIDAHGCMENNTDGAVKALEAGADAGIIPREEYVRQTSLLKAATDLERARGMAGKTYLKPADSPTKYAVCKRIIETLSAGGKVSVAMIAKKELAYRFADMFLAVDEARRRYGGEVRYIANMDPGLGLPRIRRSRRVRHRGRQNEEEDRFLRSRPQDLHGDLPLLSRHQGGRHTDHRPAEGAGQLPEPGAVRRGGDLLP